MQSEISLLFLLLSFANCISKYPILIVISFDGFRYDFVGKKTPTILALRKEGTYAQYINNVFPTKTFPNHHSIATGLYTEVHGVMANNYYDPKHQQIIKYSYEMFHYNEDIVPIWTHNERAARDRYSGIMMWPGGSFPYQNTYPQYFKEFDPQMGWNERIDKVISWIMDPEKPANLIMLYIEEPDSHSHAFGPDSPVINDMIKRLDNLTHYLLKKLEENNLLEKVNLVFVSDHGMDNVSPPHFIDITEYLEPHTYDIAGSSPVLHILPHEGYEEAIYENLTTFSKKQGHFTVFKKENLLSRWYFKNNPRTPPIFLLADDGYGFQDLAISAEYLSKKFNFKVTNKSTFGVHGYDNLDLKMKPYFVARGPKIKKNKMVIPFWSVDLYSLFCEVLEVPQLPTNGSLLRVQDILVARPYFIQVFPKFVLVAGGIVITLILTLVFVALVVYYFIRRQQNMTTAAALSKRFPQSYNNSILEAQRLLDEEASLI